MAAARKMSVSRHTRDMTRRRLSQMSLPGMEGGGGEKKEDSRAAALGTLSMILADPCECEIFESFLHSEYKPYVYWWELVEMLRRLVLVGLFVLYERGSLMQVTRGARRALPLPAPASSALLATLSSSDQASSCPASKLSSSDPRSSSESSIVMTLRFALSMTG